VPQSDYKAAASSGLSYTVGMPHILHTVKPERVRRPRSKVTLVLEIPEIRKKPGSRHLAPRAVLMLSAWGEE
jgi:hypothetical protein